MGGIGKIISGGLSLFGAAKADKAAGKAQDSADAAFAAKIKADEKKLAFEKEKYGDWQETYGGVEDNLSGYYKSLTPDYFAVQGLEAFEKEQGTALERVRENLAQRGIEDSGIAASTELAFATEGAEQRAAIRAEAPSRAAEEKMRFLSVGLGQNPGSSYSQALAGSASEASQTAGRLTQRADAASATAGTAVGAAVETVGTALSDYFD